MSTSIQEYNQNLPSDIGSIADKLKQLIDQELTEATSKVWHAHPVWFIEDNPIVGYSLQKKGLRLMFWSGMSFEEPLLNVHGKKFKDASVFFQSLDEINPSFIQNWLKKGRDIQWDYKNIVKRKGELLRLK